MTAAPPPQPYLDVRREAILQRMAAKEVLRRAFETMPPQMRDAEADSVHGEFDMATTWLRHRPVVAQWIHQNIHVLTAIVDSLIHNTALGTQRQAFIDYLHRTDANGLLAKIDHVATDAQRYPHASLSERLAYAGLLPMFGFPTQVRLLYQEAPKSLPPEREIDRTLDLAISQFAPGSQTIKDKKVLTAVGVVDYAWHQGRVVAVDGRGYQRHLGDCRCCGALAFRNHQPPPVQCPVCHAAPPEYRLLDTWEPRGFTVEPGAEEDFDGDFEWTPRATSARLCTEPLPGFQPLPSKNIEYLQKEDDLLSLNSNEGAGFPFHKLAGKEIWVVPSHLQDRWQSQVSTSSSTVAHVGLAAGKHTDILILRLAQCPLELNLDMAGPQRLYTRAAYYSWAYLLRKAACDFLDVEPAELDITLRPVTTASGAVGEIVLFDSLENGAGYCRYLRERFEEALLKPLMPGGKLYEQLLRERHAQSCDASCYDCLRDYNNAELHPLLDWRRGLDLARLSMNHRIPITLQDYWQCPTQHAAISLQRIIGTGADIRTIEDIPILYVAGRARAALTHPLWSTQHVTLMRLASHRDIATTALSYCTIFDALRRPGWCESQLRCERAS
jgi:hypothetical protein